MNDRSVTARVDQLVQPLLAANGLELVEVCYKQGKGRSLLQLFIDKPGGVTIDDCQQTSRELSMILEVEDVIPCAYVLEVSSPGLDRPLRTARDFERNMGKLVTIKARAEQGRQAAIVGRISGIDGDEVTIATGDEESLSMKIAGIVNARLKLDF